MPDLQRPFFVVLAAVFVTSCATPAVTSPALRARLQPEWIASAERVRSGDRTIYYRGQARASARNAGAYWSGTVRGEILALDPQMAIIIPAGTLTLGPDQGLAITGPQQIVTSDAPAWKHLLQP